MASRRSAHVIQGAAHSRGAAVEHVGVDHGGLDVLVAEQFLDGAYVVTGFEQVGGKRMAKSVAAGAIAAALCP